MPGKHNAGGCGCCGLDCDSCDEVTYFTIDIAEPVCAGTADPDPGHCDRNNGTYVFRTVGSQTINTCTWVVSPLAAGNCYSEFESTYIGYGARSSGTPVFPCGTGPMTAIIEFVASGGGVQVSVYLQYAYVNENYGSGIVNAATYLFTFRDTFDTCADAIGQTLPLVSTTVTVCTGSAPGDYCDVASAVVTIG